MADLEGFIGAAAALHGSGLRRSAKALLDEADRLFGDATRRADINKLKAAVKKDLGLPYSRIPDGFYALTTYEGIGVVVPIHAEEGASPHPCCDQEAERAWSTAQILVRDMKARAETARKGIGPLHPRVPAPIQLAGASCALSSALAMRSRLTGVKPPRPVFATGMLTDTGIIEPVGQTTAKIQAAINEIEGTTAFILVPTDVDQSAYPAGMVQPVHNLNAAVRIAFYEPPRPSVASRPPRKHYSAPFLLPPVFLLIAALVLGAATIAAISLWLLFKFIPERIQRQEVIEAFKSFDVAYAKCDFPSYFSLFAPILEAYYLLPNLKKHVITREDVFKGDRSKRFSENCVIWPDSRHLNSAIQFIEQEPELVILGACPQERWSEDTCMKDDRDSPMESYDKIYCMRLVDSAWKVSCEMSLNLHPTGLARFREMYELRPDPDDWIDIWQ